MVLLKIRLQKSWIILATGHMVKLRQTMSEGT